MKLKKFLSCALSLALLSTGAACGTQNSASDSSSNVLDSSNSSSNASDPSDTSTGSSDSVTSSEVDFIEVWSDGLTKSFVKGETYTLNIDQEIGDYNYIKFDFTTACALTATMNFTSTEDDSQTYSELFFIGAGDEEFRQILDYYHQNKFSKTLRNIQFTCVSGSGELNFNTVSVATHPIDFSRVNFANPTLSSTESCMKLYIQGENVKLGINLKFGGAIDYLSSIGEGIGLSYDVNGKVYVGDSVKGNLVYEDDVNLINACDTGRLVQQSFYGTKGNSLEKPQDSYICGTYAPSGVEIEWPYNPVQGGDKYQNLSQLVDVQFTDSKIYTKCRPMDWAKDGETTPFYMENTYEIISDGVYGEYVSVDNKSTDFSGYAHNNIRDQELPAFYGITPLGKLVTYKGDSPWQGKSTTTMSNLGFWSPGVAGENRFNATENWIAWVNDDDWGIGLYVPDIEKMLAGRNGYSVEISAIGLDPSTAAPCTYTAPLGVFSMPTYQSFSYRYYLKLDYAELSRELFTSLHENGANNAEIVALQNQY